MDPISLTPWLALSFTKGLSNNDKLHLLKNTGSAQTLIENARSLPLKKDIILQLQHPDTKRIHDTLRWLQESPDHHIIHLGAKLYPLQLAAINSPPLLLYVSGEARCLQNTQVAIVGSRRASPYGLKHAGQFAHDLSQIGISITSGLALGIDAAAHEGALKTHTPTIAVLGSGIKNIYPKRHVHLADRISHHGAIISELPLNAPPLAHHFPQRNRIISGLAKGTLVIEATHNSGSLITARLANEQGREVFALPGAIHHHQSQGTLQLIQEGAKCITCIQDITEEIGHKLNTPRNTNAEISTQKLDSTQHHLLECVDFTVTSIQDIHKISQLSIKGVTQQLLLLELLGYITRVPGGYIRVS